MELLTCPACGLGVARMDDGAGGVALVDDDGIRPPEPPYDPTRHSLHECKGGKQ